jgi:hypothetical protein
MFCLIFSCSSGLEMPGIISKLTRLYSCMYGLVRFYAKSLAWYRLPIGLRSLALDLDFPL